MINWENGLVNLEPIDREIEKMHKELWNQMRKIEKNYV